MATRRQSFTEERHKPARATATALALFLSTGVAGSRPAVAAQGPQASSTTGWVCGQVFDESHGVVLGARLTVVQETMAESAPTPLAEAGTDERGQFCLQDLAPGFYLLRVEHAPWPPQYPRRVEARAGLVNRLTPPIELELEPGEPRVSYEESFDGMSTSEARGVMERLLRRGDATSVHEAARRLLPKRGVSVNLNRLTLGLEAKPLIDELLRQLDRGLPPLKTARYIYVLGELADQRTREVVMPELLRRLNDGRLLPSNPTLGEGESSTYVSDIAINAVLRFSGKDFKWNYGKPPIQNQRAIANAKEWWRLELERASEKKR